MNANPMGPQIECSKLPGFLQLGEGIRMRPILWNDLLHLNYLASYQQFFSPSNSRYFFQRFTLDLSHDFALYSLLTCTPLTAECSWCFC